MTILSNLPDHQVEHVCGLGHLGGVEHQVDVVILSENVVREGDVNDISTNSNFTFAQKTPHVNVSSSEIIVQKKVFFPV